MRNCEQSRVAGNHDANPGHMMIGQRRCRKSCI